MALTHTETKGESIHLIFSDDGENICNHIERYLPSESFRIHTQHVNNSNVTEPNDGIMVLILTPEMLEEIQKKQCPGFFHNFKRRSQNVLFCYEDIEVNEPSTKKLLESKLTKIENWKIIKFGNTGSKFKIAVLGLMEILDESTFSAPVLLNYKITPKSVWKATDDIVITFKKELCDVSVHLQSEKAPTKIMKCTKLNEMTFKFNPEGMPEGEITVEVFSATTSLGKTNFTIRTKMEQLSELLGDVINPIDLFCETLKCGQSDSKTLDLELTDILTNGVEKGNPLAGLEDYDEHDSLWNQKSSHELPTILHLGAKLGLTSFCQTLMKYPGYRAASSMKNKNGKTPSQMAPLGFLSKSHSRLQDDNIDEYGHTPSNRSSNNSITSLNENVRLMVPLDEHLARYEGSLNESFEVDEWEDGYLTMHSLGETQVRPLQEQKIHLQSAEHVPDFRDSGIDVKYRSSKEFRSRSHSEEVHSFSELNNRSFTNSSNYSTDPDNRQRERRKSQTSDRINKYWAEDKALPEDFASKNTTKL